jgi:diaminopimelate decarboxylase
MIETLNAPQHAPISHWPVQNDTLVVGGMSLTDLAERIGRTPFYAYDRRLIDSRIAHLRRYLPAQVKLYYAVKANPMPAVACHLARLVDGFDIASGGELKVALAAGMNPRDISFAGPGKSVAELKDSVAAGILISIESQREVDILAEIRRESGQEARVVVRINPDFELKSSGMKMGGGPKPFGIDSESVPRVIERVDRAGLTLEGFHIFSGSQNLNAAAICESQEKAFELALRLAPSMKTPLTVLNIGGGFGIPYFPGERPLDLGPIAEHLARLIVRSKSVLPHVSFVLELGRYLIGEAGIYVCRVIERKVSRGEVFLITDGGMHHHLAASGNFGQVIRKNYPVVIGTRVRGEKRERASVVGPLCTPLDVLADRAELAEAREGDLVAVFQSGAYGLTASPTGFLSHPAAAEVLV